MAPAPVGKKSRPSASRSSSTTASSAKGARKNGAGSSGDEWRERDQEDARAQGWELVLCIDEKTRKVFFEIMYSDTRFTNDNQARAFVMGQNKAGDELAIRALRVVFRSKAGDTGRTKK